MDSGDLERGIEAFLRTRGGQAPGSEIARELLGVRSGNDDAAGRMIERLLGAAPRLIRRAGQLWRLASAGNARDATEAGAQAHPAEGPLHAPSILAAADVRRKAPHPTRLALILVEAGQPAATIEWPGTRADKVRRMARGRAVVVAGPAAEAQAVAAWLDPSLRSVVFSLERLRRRAGWRVPRARGERGEEAGDLLPRERAMRSLPLFRELADRLDREGVASWEQVEGWIERGPGFDFTGRLFDRKTLSSLPSGPGVYRFYDSAGQLVYVGQSRRLRERVSSYFRASALPAGRQARIAARAHRIEIIPEGSDLAAAVREASEIRRMRPDANTQRSVRERKTAIPWRGERVVVLPSARGRSREVFFVRDGAVIDRRTMAPGPTAARRAETLLVRHFYGGASPGLKGQHPRLASRPGISKRSSEEASRLLASWVRRRGDGILSFDPTESAGVKDAARRLLAYLEADPAEGALFIR